MTSFELLRLLKLKKKNQHYIYFYAFIIQNTLSVTSYIIYEKINKYASNFIIINGIKIKLCT